MTLNSRTRTNLFLFLFLGVQLALPLRGFLHDKFESRGNFSWNMYSTRYSCRAGYGLVRSNGERVSLEHRAYFRRPIGFARVAHRDRLPRFHAWLCHKLQGQGRELYGSVRCRVDEGPAQKLVLETVNLCAAEDYGVIEP